MPEEPAILAEGDFGLFGVLHRPDAEGAPALALVLCPPFAEEKKGAHRLLVDLARVLASRGVPVLRFDYRGTGDSEGDFTDFTLSGAEADTRRAIAFLRERYPGVPVGLLGVRLGAAAAARVAEEDGAIACLALWEPITNGRRYAQMNLRQKRIREMLTAKEGASGLQIADCGAHIGEATDTAADPRASATPALPHSQTPTQSPVPRPPSPVPEEGGYDFDGYWVTPALHAEMEALLFPGKVEHAPARVLGVSVNAAGRVARELEAVLAPYASAGASVQTCAVTAEPFWSLQDPVPVPDLMNTTAEWVLQAGDSPPLVSPRTRGKEDSLPACGEGRGGGSVSLCGGEEKPVRFGSGGRVLHGILSMPAKPVRPVTGLITLHGWSGTRIGPHALFVSLARRAAGAGYASLRFDFRGRGDSEGELSEATRATMVEDAVAAARFLRDSAGCERVLLVGLCAGSQVAIGGASSGAAPDGLVLWSAPVSEQAEEEKAVAAKRRHFLAEYARKLLRPQTWRKLIGGKLQLRKIARVVSGKAGIAATDDRTVDLQAAARLKEFAGPILFLYGTHDPIAPVALPYYQRILADRQAQVSVAHLEGANHSFYGTAWREEVLERTLAWLAERFPA